MKLSNTTLIIFLFVFLLFVPLTIFCQTEKLDIIQYTPPKGWSRSEKEGVVIFTSDNKEAGSFCIVTLYASAPSAGSPQKDFTGKWNELVVTPFKADANPKTQSDTQDGWTVVSGSSQIDLSGTKSLVFMSVVSGYGRTVSTYAIFNDQSFVSPLEEFVSSIKLDKTASKTKVDPPAGSNAVDAQANDPFPTQPGYAPQKPLSGILKPSITIADLVGIWDKGAGSVQTYIDTYTGDYAGTNTTFYGEKYVIHADGGFDYLFVGRSSNRTVKETDGGTVSLSGGYIIFKFKARDEHKYQFIAFNVQPGGASILSLVQAHDTFQGYDAAGMKLECGHGNGFISCVGGEQWARLK